MVFQKTILHIVKINNMSPVKRVPFVSSGEDDYIDAKKQKQFQKRYGNLHNIADLQPGLLQELSRN